MKKIIYSGIAIAALIVLLLYMLGMIGHSKTPPGSTALQQQSLDALDKAVVISKVVDDVLSWPGTVRSRTEAKIAPRVTARIMEITVNAGDKVKKGDIIARLDQKALRAQKLAAADLAAARADWQRALADERRIRSLFAKQAATKETFDRVVAQARAAKARVDAASSALHEISINLAETTLKAPFDGVIVERLKEPGDMDLAGVPIVVIHNSAALRLETAVPTQCALHLQLGARVPVRIETLPEMMTAEIDEITPEVDPETRTILIKATLPLEKKLQPGLFGWLDQACSRHTALLIPARAVRRIGQLEIVKVLVNDRPLTRHVRTGKRHGDLVKIQSLTAMESEAKAVSPR